MKVTPPRPTLYDPAVLAPVLDHAGTTAQNADWRPRLAATGQRLQAQAQMLIADHGLFRLIWKNREQIAPEVWRSNQPSPGDLAWAKAQGVRTIVSARGGIAFGSYPLEREACEQLGLDFRVFAFGSRAAPEAALIRAAEPFFRSLEYPILIHCKSGADRAGFLSALYLILIEGMDVRQAMESQLAFRFGHLRHSKSGVLDHVFEHYLRDNERQPLSFADWLQTIYDPATIAADFKPKLLADLLSSRLAGHE